MLQDENRISSCVHVNINTRVLVTSPSGDAPRLEVDAVVLVSTLSFAELLPGAERDKFGFCVP